MQWVNVNKEKENNAYELWYNEKKVMSLSFSAATQIARLETGPEKRLFFVEKKGFFQKKRSVLKNEYGVKLGQLHSDNNAAEEGSIEMDGNKYSYTVNDNNEVSLALSDETGSERKPFLRCNITGVIDSAAALVQRSISFHDSKLPLLLMTLCWYLKTNRF